MILSASVMCMPLFNIQREIELLDMAGIDSYHIDIMDGEFVNNFGLSWLDVKTIWECTAFPLDIHLMVANPKPHIELASAIGANTVYVHYELGKNVKYFLKRIKYLGMQAGLAISPSIKYEEIDKKLIDLADKLLILRVAPGFAGQKAIPEVEDKIAAILENHKDKQILLDGNITNDTISKWNNFVDNKDKLEYVLGTAALFYNSIMDYNDKLKILKRELSL